MPQQRWDAFKWVQELCELDCADALGNTWALYFVQIDAFSTLMSTDANDPAFFQKATEYRDAVQRCYDAMGRHIAALGQLYVGASPKLSAASM